MLEHELLCVSGAGVCGMDVTCKNSTDSNSRSEFNQGSPSDHDVYHVVVCFHLFVHLLSLDYQHETDEKQYAS